MSIGLPCGILVVSIDLELDAQHCRPQQQRSLDRVATQLLDLLIKFQLPATWAVADPAISAATDKLLAAGAGHEIAVLGDQAWVGSNAGRLRFGRELQRRVTRGRELGLPLTTLALRNASLDAHLDLVVKNGITAVRGAASASQRKTAGDQPQSLYAGLWMMWPSHVLPGNSRWWPGGGRIRAARRGLEQSAARREVFHLMINGLDLTERSWVALRGIEKIVRRADQLRSQGRLEIATLNDAVTRLTNLRQTVPARSILRPAA
jgi:hypothetical protein